jgi:hypothetical protein
MTPQNVSVEHGVRIMLLLSLGILDAIKIRGYASLATVAVLKLSVIVSKYLDLIGFNVTSCYTVVVLLAINNCWLWRKHD